MALYELITLSTNEAHRRISEAISSAEGRAFHITHFSVGDQGHDPNDPTQAKDLDPDITFPEDQILIPAKALEEVILDQIDPVFVAKLEGDEALGEFSSFYLWATVVWNPRLEEELRLAGFTQDNNAVVVPVNILQSGVGNIIHDPNTNPRLDLTLAQQQSSANYDPPWGGFTGADVARILVFSTAQENVNRGTFPVLTSPANNVLYFDNPVAIHEHNVEWSLAESLSLAPLRAKVGVPRFQDLPVSGNQTGDKRTVLLSGLEYWWNGTTWRPLTERFLFAISHQPRAIRAPGQVDTIHMAIQMG